jgi:POT family proton-dependent oligopeptide transporter
MAAKHPKGLYVLFFTELWERFGFYLMLSIFTLYLNEYLKMSEGDSASLYGTYIGLVYLSPLFGGILADRLIGYNRAVIGGAALLSIGYFLLSFNRPETFFISLGVMILGNGLFKPNISTLVGNLYPQGDVRRDSAFSIFYMGINIGAFFAPLAAGYTRTHLGWGPAFATAGVGMFIGLLIFVLGRKHLAVANQRSSVSAVLDVPLPAEYEDKPEPPAVERERLRALVVMCVIVMLFWVAFHQNGSTLTFWARDNTDRTLGGLVKDPINPEYFAAINSFFVVGLTPVLIAVFSWLRKRGLEPSTPGKIGIGMVLTALAYVVMVVASLAGGNSGRVSALWITGSYFVVTVAELCLSPMGLSMVTKLSPRRMTAMMMGVWFLATALGNKISGEIGVFWNRWPHHIFFGALVGSSLLAAAMLAVQLRRLAAAMPKEGQG